LVECHGNGPDHCCYLGKHGICPHLEENTVPGRRWACALRRSFGSWTDVHSSPRYLNEVKPKLVDIGIELDCGDWPQKDSNVMTNPAMGRCCYESEVTIGNPHSD
jgi:hypothetical protein